MIVTLTANPSVDRTIALAGELRRGAVLRASSMSSQAGGKGVNISRAAVAAGIPSVAVLPAQPDSSFVTELRAAGIDCRPQEPAGPIRVNLAITSDKGILAEVSSRVAGINTNIRNVEATVDDQRGRINMTVEISDVKHLQKVVKALRGIQGVLDVERAAR